MSEGPGTDSPDDPGAAAVGPGAPGSDPTASEALAAERATYARQRDFVSRRDRKMSDAANHVVVEIDRALTRISDGTYGLCEWCAQPIGEARLEALPHAALCIGCQSRQERND